MSVPPTCHEARVRLHCAAQGKGRMLWHRAETGDPQGPSRAGTQLCGMHLPSSRKGLAWIPSTAEKWVQGIWAGGAKMKQRE